MTSKQENGAALMHEFRDGLEKARSEFSELDQRARVLVRQRPIAALLAAIGLGFVVARISSRL